MAEDSEARPEVVTLEEFSEPLQAEMARLRLQSAGIETFLSGENAAIMAPGLGPLELQVRREDEADARAILEDAGEDAPDEPTTEPDVS
jgi:Putative prokaryotic signal transducing protein